MRGFLILLIASVTLGLAGGYGWSVWTAPPPHHAKPPKAAFAPIPESPEALPAEPDKEWTARSEDKGTPIAIGPAPVEQNNSGCPEARAVDPCAPAQPAAKPVSK